ncbi:MAG TPA: LEPR-XLL domain-containing protein, partial [Candidatus Limnocylindrales bacterium]
MLRKLFGFPPARVVRPVRTASRAPVAPAEAASHRRKPVLEALESRLLLSADPLGVLDGAGVLALQLGDGDDQALVERVGASAAGGDIVAVTLGTVTQQYGDEFFGIVRLLIDAGAGDDWLRIVGVTVTTDIVGGLGTDTFEWQQGDATWSITARDTGAVETVSFSSFEHLVGGDDNRDTFLFAAGAAVSGGVEGGAGGFDSIVIQGGEYQSVTYTANAAGADRIALDDRVIAYDGIEAGTLGATAASLTLNATAADDVVRLREDAGSGRSLLESVTGSFADFTFGSPTASLTINLGAGDDRITIETFDHGFSAALDVRGGDGRDRIDFAGTVATHGHDLSAAGEQIVVAPGSTLRTDGGAGGTVADLVLAAEAASTNALGAADASVTMVDATLIGRNIAISATATFTGDADFIDGGAAATVDIFGSEVTADRAIAIDVHSFALATTDAAAADVTVTSTAAARIGGAATLEAGDDFALDVLNVVDVTAAGGPAAVAAIALDTIVLVDGGATVAAQEVRLHAASDASLALAGVVAVAELESTARADLAGGFAIDLGRRTSLASAESEARTIAGTLADEAPRPALDRDPARPIDAAADAAASSDDSGHTADLYRVATGRPLPEAGEAAAELFHAGPGERLEGALAAPGTFDFPAEPQSDDMPAAEGALVRSALAGAIGLLPTADGDADPRSGRRPGVESDPDGDDGDPGLGASLALSMIKDSALAELARSVATGGGVALSAGATPFVRGRARGAPGSDEA